MSDANLLSRQLIKAELGGASYVLSALTLDEELLFQAELEAFASGRLEATRAKIGEQAYQRQLSKLLEMITTNAYAWAGYLCNRYLLTPEGMAHLIFLLAQKGQKEKGAIPNRELFTRLARAEGEEWQKVASDVLRRDFPNLWAALRASSEAPATP